MVKLPSYEWFMGQLAFRGKGNVYSGSIGCDPELGDIEGNVFRYRVWIDKDENDEKILIAGYYYGLYCYDATPSTEKTEKIFEVSSDGISQAQQWIIDSYNDSRGDNNV